MEESPYLLSNTQNKRGIIYKNNITIDTKAFTLNYNFRF